MFEVVDHGSIRDAFVVRGLDGSAGRVAVFSGPEAHYRAEAYAAWLNAGAALQRRRGDAGSKGGNGPGR